VSDVTLSDTNSKPEPQRPITGNAEPDHEAAKPIAQGLSNVESKPTGVASRPVFNEAMIIREFDKRERDRGPIFAGFIVNDLLVRFGFDVTGAKRVLRAMEAQDMVRTERKPNPKSPDRETTFVTLNRQHPQVRRVLEGDSLAERTFPIATNTGTPLSEIILRERR